MNTPDLYELGPGDLHEPDDALEYAERADEDDWALYYAALAEEEGEDG